MLLECLPGWHFDHIPSADWQCHILTMHDMQEYSFGEFQSTVCHGLNIALVLCNTCSHPYFLTQLSCKMNQSHQHAMMRHSNPAWQAESACTIIYMYVSAFLWVDWSIVTSDPLDNSAIVSSAKPPGMINSQFWKMLFALMGICWLRNSVRLDLLSGRSMNCFHLTGKRTSLPLILWRIDLLGPECLALVPDFMDSFLYLSKTTTTWVVVEYPPASRAVQVQFLAGAGIQRFDPFLLTLKCKCSLRLAWQWW